MKNRLLILVLLMGLGSSSFAQKYSLWGFKAAPLISSIDNYETSNFGFSAGLVGDWLIGGDFYSLYGEINYTQFKGDLNSSTFTFKTLDIPLTFKMEFLANAFYGQAGVRTQFVLNATSDISNINNSLIIGLGKEIYPNGGKAPFFVSVYYDYGLTDLGRNDGITSNSSFITLNIGKKFWGTGY